MGCRVGAHHGREVSCDTASDGDTAASGGGSLLGWISQRWKSAWAKYLATLKPRSSGFLSPVDKALGRGGRPLAQLVIEALDSNRITAVQACWYLDLRFDHFEKLRAELRYGSRSTQTLDDGD